MLYAHTAWKISGISQLCRQSGVNGSGQSCAFADDMLVGLLRFGKQSIVLQSEPKMRAAARWPCAIPRNRRKSRRKAPRNPDVLGAEPARWTASSVGYYR